MLVAAALIATTVAEAPHAVDALQRQIDGVTLERCVCERCGAAKDGSAGARVVGRAAVADVRRGMYSKKF